MNRKQVKDVPVVRDFMTSPVITVTADMEAHEAIGLLLKHRISGAPVVEMDGMDKRLVGIISEKDFLAILTGGAFYDQEPSKVADFMKTECLTVEPDTDLFTVADIFMKVHYRRLPVVEDGRLVGIVSRRDVLNSSKHLWGSPGDNPPDPGFIPESVKSRLGQQGLPTVEKVNR